MSKIRLSPRFGLCSGPSWLCHITMNGKMEGTCERSYSEKESHTEWSGARLAVL
jgi:hypothetical protein